MVTRSARTRKWSTTNANGVDQPTTKTDDDDVPDASPDPPIPPKPPDESPQLRDGVAHAEHEGEWSGCKRLGNARSSIYADASGASGSVDDARECPNDLQNGSERVSERQERQVVTCTPSGTQVKQTASNGHADASGRHEDARNVPNELQNTSERISKRPKRQVELCASDRAQVERTATDDQTDASGASGHVEDTRDVSTNLQEVPDRVKEVPEGVEENSPQSAPGNSEDPNGETAASHSVKGLSTL